MPKNPGVFDSFQGLWARGPITDTPKDHFSDSRNNKFNGTSVLTRGGCSTFLSASGIVRQHVYKPNPSDGGPRLIWMNEDGELYDVNYGSPITTMAGASDFALVNFFGRAYICFSDGKQGLSGEILYVYDGTGPTGFRAAAGGAATTAITGSATFDGVGKLEQGEYLITYAFETDSGFITHLATPLLLQCGLRNATGIPGNSGNLTNIPLGPAGTVARWLIATQLIPMNSDGNFTYNGDPYGYDFFFLQRIGDNVTTTQTVSWFDNELGDDANYLLNTLTEIPAGVGLTEYKGRLVVYGSEDDPSLVRVSAPGEPENFSATSGFIIVDPADSTGVRCVTTYRNFLYLAKSQRFYVTADNGGEASTWELDGFEKSIGTEPYGIASILDSKGSSSDGFLIADRGGLVYFNGAFQDDPELSYKIRDLWKRINENYFYKTQVVLNPVTKEFYVLVPLDTNTSVSHIIYGNYENGLGPRTIRWDLWEFTDFAPRSLSIYTDFSDDNPSLTTKLAHSEGVIVTLNDSLNDVNTPINAFIELSPVRFGIGVSVFSEYILGMDGPCNVDIKFFPKGKRKSFNTSREIVSSNPDRDYYGLCNVVSEYCSTRLAVNGYNERYRLDSFVLKGREIWGSRGQ